MAGSNEGGGGGGNGGWIAITIAHASAATEPRMQRVEAGRQQHRRPRARDPEEPHRRQHRLPYAHVHQLY